MFLKKVFQQPSSTIIYIETLAHYNASEIGILNEWIFSNTINHQFLMKFISEFPGPTQAVPIWHPLAIKYPGLTTPSQLVPFLIYCLINCSRSDYA